MLLVELGDYLSTNGVGTVGTDLFLGFMPDTPNGCVALYETGGLGPARAMRGSAGQPVAERPRVQVVARSTSYASARAKARDAYLLLEGLGDVTLNGVQYKWVGAVQEPFMMGRDELGRVSIAANYDVVKSLSTA